MSRQLKMSNKMHRNIKGIYYEHYTSHPDEFKQCKQECQEKGLKYRIINGEFFIESTK